MQIKSKGIILRSVRHNEKSTIVTVYTCETGRTSFILYGSSGKRGNNRRAALLPLSVVDIEASGHQGKELQTIKEITVIYSFTGISSDPVRNAIALFIAELLNKSIRQSEADSQLFQFLENSVMLLDQCEEGIANFHLVFMIKLTRFLGFEPNDENMDLPVFDLQNGCFTGSLPTHPHFISPEMTKNFRNLMQTGFSNMHGLRLTREKRNELLAGLLIYYRLHLTDFHGLKSTDVMQELFI